MGNNGLNKKILFEQIIVTFIILAIFWIPCIILGVNGITIKKHYFIYVPWFLGGISPAISSFIILKRNNGISFINWLKNIFDFKHNFCSYLLAIILPIIHLVLMCLLSGYNKGLPLYYLTLMIIAMIFAGGLEEAGWRYIVHSELNKKFGFVISVLITALIWWLWHLPLFFIPDVSQFQKNFFIFGIMVLGMSFMLATIKDITGSVWLCILCHAIINSLGNFYHYDMYKSYSSACITTIIMIIISLILMYLFRKNKRNVLWC